MQHFNEFNEQWCCSQIIYLISSDAVELLMMWPVNVADLSLQLTVLEPPVLQ